MRNSTSSCSHGRTACPERAYSFFPFVFVFVFFGGLGGATFFGSFAGFSFFGSFAGFSFFGSSRRSRRAFGCATSTGFTSSLGLLASGGFSAFTTVSAVGFSGLGLAACNQPVSLVTLPSRAVLLLMSSGTLHFLALSKESAEAESSPREKPRAALSIIPPACRVLTIASGGGPFGSVSVSTRVLAFSTFTSRFCAGTSSPLSSSLSLRLLAYPVPVIIVVFLPFPIR